MSSDNVPRFSTAIKAAAIDYAKRMYCDPSKGDIETDAEPTSPDELFACNGTLGIWVEAWLYVPRTKLPTEYNCPACRWCGIATELGGLQQLPAIDKVLRPGELVPAGTCPVCHALIHVREADVPDTTLTTCQRIAQERTLPAPAPVLSIASQP